MDMTGSGTTGRSLREKVAARGLRHHILERIGQTPLIELRRIASEVAPVRIFGKAEHMNPGGSVKDRPALNMVLEGEAAGKLTDKKILLDATSGNTGIAYAMIGAALGYRVKLAVPRNISAARLNILSAYGAELVLTDPALGSDGAIVEASRMYRENPDAYFYPDQYNNPANWQSHYFGTAEEIIHDTGGHLTHFIATLGTTGTFVGTGRRLREFNPHIRLVSVQPDSPMHGLEGMKHLPTSMVPGIYDAKLADQNVEVRTEDAQAMVKRLAREEGLLVGMSAGAAVHAALDLARKMQTGTIVTILCDGGQKYLDMEFWRT
jgi:cysteine synthase B